MSEAVMTETRQHKLHYRGRGSQIIIYLGKLLRGFVYQNDWKVMPMVALIAGLVSMVVRRDFFQTMEYMTNAKLTPAYCLRPEDVLIQMYGNHKSGDFKDDPVFCHILRCIGGDDRFPFSHLPPSSYNEDFLQANLWSHDTSIEWCNSIFAQLPDIPALDYYNVPLLGIFLDGEYTLIGKVTLYPGTDKEKSNQYVAVRYDFSTGKAISYEIAPASPFEKEDQKENADS